MSALKLAAIGSAIILAVTAAAAFERFTTAHIHAQLQEQLL